MSDIKAVSNLDIEELKPGETSKLWLHLVDNGIGEPIRIPIMIKKGMNKGPTLGLTAAIHGNELNGISVIQTVFKKIDASKLNGTLIGVLASNIPGLLVQKRHFSDGVDLNRIAPGKAVGTEAEVYINRFMERIIKKFGHHIDLHTASFGRVNSHYVRASLDNEETAKLAKLQSAQIVVNKRVDDKTLRGAAQKMGINSITVELKDPFIFQSCVTDSAVQGVKNVMSHLGMIDEVILCPPRKTIICHESNWLYTDRGGILKVFPEVATIVKKGDLLAELTDIFGETIKSYFAQQESVVIGKSINPICQTGGRIIHLGHSPEFLDECN